MIGKMGQEGVIFSKTLNIQISITIEVIGGTVIIISKNNYP